MLKIDPAFLFELGPSLRSIRTVNSKTQMVQGFWILDVAKEQIEQVINQSIYAHLLRGPTRASANALVAQIDAMQAVPDDDPEWAEKTHNVYHINKLWQLYSKFETLLVADLQASALYLVSPKGGFDVDSLIEYGGVLFSDELAKKVPDAMPDIRQATRCVAFELPTAAGFHLHRAHESVLRVYWDCVTGNAPRPDEQNMGVYLRELDKKKAGKQEVRSHLRSIKDFHRNPLMHPEQSLESVDEALDLLSAIRCSIGYMLREIPNPAGPMLPQMVAP